MYTTPRYTRYTTLHHATPVFTQEGAAHIPRGNIQMLHIVYTLFTHCLVRQVCQIEYVWE